MRLKPYLAAVLAVLAALAAGPFAAAPRDGSTCRRRCTSTT